MKKKSLFVALLYVLYLPTYISGNGIATGNTAQNITVKDGATLTANVGNADGSTLTISDRRGKIKDISDTGTRTNSVSNINAGTSNTITNNVGNNNYNAPSTIQQLEVTNSVGTATVAEGASLVNNIGTTANHNYANFTNATTVVENKTEVYLTKGESLKFLQDSNAVENLSMVRRLLEMLLSSSGKIESINIKYADNQPLTAQSAETRRISEVDWIVIFTLLSFLVV